MGGCQKGFRFFPLIKTPPDGMECGHIDGVKSNNVIGNLSWVLPIANSKMSLMQGVIEKGEDRYNAMLTEDLVRRIRKEYRPKKVTQAMLAEQYGVTRDAVQRVLCGRTWKHVK